MGWAHDAPAIRESGSLRMKKFLNDPKNVVQELLEGYVLAYPGKVRLSAAGTVVRPFPRNRERSAWSPSAEAATNRD